MKKLLIILTCLLFIGCLEKTQPIITDSIGNPEIEQKKENFQEIIEPEQKKVVKQQSKVESKKDLILGDVVNTKQLIKLTSMQIPQPPSGEDYCDDEDFYEGLGPDGFVGAQIEGEVNFKYGKYCKATAKFTKNNVNFEYIFYYKESNNDVWLERIIDGKKDLIHVMEFKNILI